MRLWATVFSALMLCEGKLTDAQTNRQSVVDFYAAHSDANKHEKRQTKK